MITAATTQTKLRTTWLTLIMTTIALLNVIGCTPLGLYSLLAPKDSIDVIVPEDFQGRVLIAYQIEGGIVPQKKGDVWQYRLQDDGALLLQSDPLSSISEYTFFYELADGTLEPIPSSTCFDDDQSSGIVVCTGGTVEVYNARALRPNQSFSIAELDEKREWTFEDYHVLYDRYFDQLVLSDDE